MRPQKDAFLAHIGDDWYEQNKDDPVADHVYVGLLLKRFPFIKPKVILEVGCSDGRRLRQLHQQYPESCIRGLEPSIKAAEAGNKAAGGVFIDRGTADKLPYPDSSVDLLIYGYCLGYCDPEDYFVIAAEGDRVLTDDGWLVIVDSNNIAANVQNAEYERFGGYHCWWFRYDFRQLWLGHPAYRLRAMHSDMKRSVVLIHKYQRRAFRPATPSSEIEKLFKVDKV